MKMIIIIYPGRIILMIWQISEYLYGDNSYWFIITVRNRLLPRVQSTLSLIHDSKERPSSPTILSPRQNRLHYQIKFTNLPSTTTDWHTIDERLYSSYICWTEWNGDHEYEDLFITVYLSTHPILHSPFQTPFNANSSNSTFCKLCLYLWSNREMHFVWSSPK